MLQDTREHRDKILACLRRGPLPPEELRVAFQRTIFPAVTIYDLMGICVAMAAGGELTTSDGRVARVGN